MTPVAFPLCTLALLIGLLLPHASPAAPIAIEGLRSFSAQELLEENAGRLEFVRTRPASPSRADDAAFLVRQSLRQHGLPRAEVSWSLRSNTILLTVVEGQERTLGELELLGESPITPEKLLKQFRAPFQKIGLTADKKTPYLEATLPAATRQALNYLRSLGYWSARLRAQPLPPTPQGAVPIRLHLHAGPPHRLGLPRLQSPLALPTPFYQKLSAHVGRTATAEEINSVRQTLLQEVQSLGYEDARVVMEKADRNAQTHLTLTVEPGARYRLGNVTWEGLTRTRPSSIQSRFESLQGRDYNAKKIRKVIDALVTTGAFNSVRLDKTPQSDQTLDLTLHLSEARARGVEFYAGAGSYEGLLLGSRYYDRNLDGRLWNLRAGVELTFLGMLGEVSLTDPFFLRRTDLRLTPRAFLITRREDGYRKLQTGLGSELNWDVNDHYRLIFGLESSLTRTSSDGLPDEDMGVKNYLVSGLKVTQRYDRRNDLALPSKGYLLQSDHFLGLTLGEDAVSFLENHFAASSYYSWHETHYLNLGARLGFLIPTDQEDLPIDLRQFTGGANSVRSFPERQLGPESNGYPTGGLAYWVVNAEYIRTVKGPIQLVTFLDGGALAADYGEIFEAPARWAIGAGLRLALPIGPVRFEYGHALNPGPEDPSGAFHFAIGATF